LTGPSFQNNAKAPRVFLCQIDIDFAPTIDLRYLLEVVTVTINWLKSKLGFLMKFLALLLTGLSCFLCRQSLAATQPQGSLLELHSCQLYAGGCIVSSESTLGGRYMLRAWHFTGGSFQGTDLTGLNLVVLQSSSDNLATAEANAGSVIVYLPADLSTGQRDTLLAWLKSSQKDLGSVVTFQTRSVPLEFSKTATGYSVSAGDFVSVKTASLESCATGACGEALWYTPRAQTSMFTVAVNRSSKVHEPLLKLTWNEAGRRSVFLGKFGENTPTENLYVSSTELCGPSERLF
jgi:hypothetical protein